MAFRDVARENAPPPLAQVVRRAASPAERSGELDGDRAQLAEDRPPEPRFARRRRARLLRLHPVWRSLEAVEALERGDHVALQQRQVHRLVDEPEDARLVDQADDELGVGGAGRHDDERLRMLLLEELEEA